MKEKIKTLRIELGYTQSELALRCGVSFQAVSKWENGTAEPTITHLVRLATVLGVSLDELVK